MTLSHKKIIRGADVDGVLFCTPAGTQLHDPVVRQEKENLKALEDFWYKKGFDEGKQKGFEEGLAEGKTEGERKGLQDGEAKGREEGRAEGHAEGLKEGEEQSKQAFFEPIEIVAATASAIKEEQASLYEEAKAEMVQFALTVCAQVLRRELADVEAFRQVIEQIIHQAQPIINDCPVGVVFSRDGLLMLQEAGLEEGLKAQLKEQTATSVRFASEEGLCSGDCRIETTMGLVNFDIKRMIGGLEKKVLEVRHDDDIGAEASSQILPQPAQEEAMNAVSAEKEQAESTVE